MSLFGSQLVYLGLALFSVYTAVDFIVILVTSDTILPSKYKILTNKNKQTVNSHLLTDTSQFMFYRIRMEITILDLFLEGNRAKRTQQVEE